jgi:hypothetical protein
MGTIGIFLKPRKYNFRSGSLDRQKDAMMDRVSRICKINGFERLILDDDSCSLKSLTKKHSFTKNSSGLKMKSINLVVLLMVIAILYFSLR